MKLVLICCTMLTTPALAGTTYSYTGAPLVASADPLAFGTNLTGSVTFNFDTAGFSGTLANILDWGIVSGRLGSGSVGTTLRNLLGDNYFTFTNGEITAWSLTLQAGCSGFSTFFVSCGIHTQTGGDTIYTTCLHCSSSAFSIGPGTWLAPVPGPVVGDLSSLFRWILRR